MRRREFLGGVCACAAGVVGGLVGGVGGYRWGQRVESQRYVSGRPTTSRRQRQAAEPDAVFDVDTDQRVVALSFDDGPDPRYTPTVLDLLAHHGAGATFFMVGVNARAFPQLVTHCLGAGHTIANHTYDHPDLTRLDAASVDLEIERASAAIVASGAPRPTLFRPPKGLTDDAVDVIAGADRYRTVFWDVCLERYLDRRSPAEAAAAAMRHIKPGSILLAHDGGHITAPSRPYLDRGPTMTALPLLLRRLRDDGYRIVDVPTLLTLGGDSGATFERAFANP